MPRRRAAISRSAVIGVTTGCLRGPRGQGTQILRSSTAPSAVVGGAKARAITTRTLASHWPTVRRRRTPSTAAAAAIVGVSVPLTRAIARREQVIAHTRSACSKILAPSQASHAALALIIRAPPRATQKGAHASVGPLWALMAKPAAVLVQRGEGASALGLAGSRASFNADMSTGVVESTVFQCVPPSLSTELA